MKMVIALIQPTKLNAVREALIRVGVERMTVCDAQGFGRQRGQTPTYRGHEYTTQFLRKIELEIVVNDDFLERTIETIVSVVRTGPEGTIGDGKIFVMPAEEAIRVSDAVRGPGGIAADSFNTGYIAMAVVLVSSDLMASSRLASFAIASGTKLITVPTAEALIARCEGGEVEAVFLDLATPGLDPKAIVPQLRALASPPCTILAYGPHVHEQRLQAARDAGCDEVISRGEFHARMDRIVAELSEGCGE